MATNTGYFSSSSRMNQVWTDVLYTFCFFQHSNILCKCEITTTTSHEHRDIAKTWQTHCLFNSLFRLAAKKRDDSGLLWNHRYSGGFLHKDPIMGKALPRRDAIIYYRRSWAAATFHILSRFSDRLNPAYLRRWQQMNIYIWLYIYIYIHIYIYAAWFGSWPTWKFKSMHSDNIHEIYNFHNLYIYI